MKTIDINADRFVRLLKALNYRVNFLFQMFKADKINVNGDVNLSNTPIEEFVGNITINGNLNLSYSNLKKFNITKVTGNVMTYSTPYQSRKNKIQTKLRQREYRRDKIFDNKISRALVYFLNKYKEVYNISDPPRNVDELYDQVESVRVSKNLNLMDIYVDDINLVIGREDVFAVYAKEINIAVLLDMIDDDIEYIVRNLIQYIDWNRLENNFKESYYDMAHEIIYDDFESFFPNYSEDDKSTYPTDEEISDRIQDFSESLMEDMIYSLKSSKNNRELVNNFDEAGIDIKYYINLNKLGEDTLDYDFLFPEGFSSFRYDGEVYYVGIRG